MMSKSAEITAKVAVSKSTKVTAAETSLVVTLNDHGVSLFDDYGYLDRVGHWFRNFDRDLDWYLDRVGYLYGHLDGYFDWVGHWFLHCVGYVFRDLHRVRLWYVDRIRTVDRHFNRHLHRVRHVLRNLHRIWVRYWHVFRDCHRLDVISGDYFVAAAETASESTAKTTVPETTVIT